MRGSFKNCIRGTSAKVIFAATRSSILEAEIPARSSPERAGVAFAISSRRSSNLYVMFPSCFVYIYMLSYNLTFIFRFHLYRSFRGIVVDDDQIFTYRLAVVQIISVTSSHDYNESDKYIEVVIDHQDKTYNSSYQSDNRKYRITYRFIRTFQIRLCLTQTEQ